MASRGLCPDCQGTFWIRVETRFGTAAKRCHCYQQELDTARYLECGLPEKLTHKSFDNFSAGDYFKERKRYNTLIAAMTKAKRFAEAFPVCKRKGLLFHGGEASEMTHLAVATLKVFIDKGLSCMFCDYQMLLEALFERGSPEARSQVAGKAFAQRIREVDVLLIDSLGEHRPNRWAVDTISQIIKRRYYSEQCLLVTTVLPLEEDPRASTQGFQEMRAYSPLHESLGYRIGHESLRRLLDHCEDIPLSVSVPDKAIGGGLGH